MAAKQLDTIIGMGRVLRVTAENTELAELPNLNNASTQELIAMLKSSKSWIRDRAQQILIYKQDAAAISDLKTMALEEKNALAQLHALYTLEGLDALSFDFLEKIAVSTSKSITISHALVLLEQFASKENLQSMSILAQKLVLKNNPEIDLYLSISLGAWAQLSEDLFFPILAQLSNKYKNKTIYQDGIINSLRSLEENYVSFLKQQDTKLSNKNFSNKITSVIANKNSNKKNSVFVQTGVHTDNRTAGYNTYRNLCAACHGMDGNGIDGFAPPLKGSEYIMESVERLALIILHGMDGPVHVDGKRYELNNIMPGLVNNSSFSDEDIVNLIDYLHNAFPNNSTGISSEEIKLLRKKKPREGNYYTEDELIKMGY